MSSPSSNSENESPSTCEQFKIIGKVVAKYRLQKYRKAWESLADYTGWLTEATGRDFGKAFCRAFNNIMTAEIIVIKNHSKSAKRMRMVKVIPKTNISTMFKKVENPLETQIKRTELKLT
ncbi:unnamed protein product [Diabrotica balteata]|uniref:Uncharacterized protein n=1 Tax=Diabrotica balteata TaxID=107213 RepID=A0A9N9T1T6_DIABA|nr:unnamed protein product [Diabrotica balteata]